MDSNTVTFVDHQGGTDVFAPTGPHMEAYGQARTTTLTDLLRNWEELVRRGVWDVDQNGVSNGSEWYEIDDNRLLFEN